MIFVRSQFLTNTLYVTINQEEALSKHKSAEKASGGNMISREPTRAIVNHSSISNNATLSSAANREVVSSKQQQEKDKKKKGLFGGLFNKKNRKGGSGALRSKGEEQGSI